LKPRKILRFVLLKKADREPTVFLFKNLLNYLKMGTKEKTRVKISLKEATSINNEIIIYNDDVNTFDHVIDTLIRVCEHTPEQAEQCSLIVHYNGKCTVKTGVLEKLKPQCTQLLEAGLSAEIV
jgi:ATP-dependent Clp protease adaptor protein ClpS